MSAAARKHRRIRRTTPELLSKYIQQRAAGASPALPCHWVSGANELRDPPCTEGTNFCEACCERMVANIFASHPEEAEDINVRVGGGHCVEHDGIPYCETCGAKLDGSLTDYGADEELGALTTYATPDDPDGWDSLDRVADNLGCFHSNSRSVLCLTAVDAPKNEPSTDLYARWLRSWRRIAKVVRRDQRARRAVSR